MSASLVGSEMCIRDSTMTQSPSAHAGNGRRAPAGHGATFSTNSKRARDLRTLSATVSGSIRGWLTCTLKLRQSVHGRLPARR
eukprot:2733315-Alexandrium_andersonii.AAC.1